MKIKKYLRYLMFFVLCGALNANQITVNKLSDLDKINFNVNIETLIFKSIKIEKFELINKFRVKALAFQQCIGNINDVLALVDKDELIEININECFLKDTLVDISGCETNSLNVYIDNSKGMFRFNNLSSISNFYFNNSELLDIDFSKLNEKIETINILRSSHFFCSNWKYISEFTELKSLELEFYNIFDEIIDINKLNSLEQISLKNFLKIPLNINTSKLKYLSLDKIYDLDSTKINQLLKSNTNIRELYIRNCNLFRIPQPIANLSKLLYLGLSDNKINSIKYDFSNLTKLRTIYLDNNYIQDFNYKLYELKLLSQIDIEFNNLKERIVKPKNNKIIIKQEGNPFIDL